MFRFSSPQIPLFWTLLSSIQQRSHIFWGDFQAFDEKSIKNICNKFEKIILCIFCLEFQKLLQSMCFSWGIEKPPLHWLSLSQIISMQLVLRCHGPRLLGIMTQGSLVLTNRSATHGSMLNYGELWPGLCEQCFHPTFVPSWMKKTENEAFGRKTFGFSGKA